ncbi:MAG: type II toxin-antitoxin system Phd/YefM family antitoxin [Micromonosporaceae bacterium]|jgi:prevent-host-death family protein|nr:type II toxin-antitoxin system Phd/YefM family antitoxin [Micromonosporaceae bacterium]
MTITVSLHEARTHLSRLIERVAAGEDVAISKAGTPVADLVPHRSAGVVFGGVRGELVYGDDAFAVDPEIQRMFYGPDDVAS